LFAASRKPRLNRARRIFRENRTLPSGIKLHQLISPRHIVDLQAATKRDALAELADLLEGDPNVGSPQIFLDAILKREELASTGVGLGVALPHVKIPEVMDYVICVGRKRGGISFDSIDGAPVNLIFMIGASEQQRTDFIRMLARVNHLLKSAPNRAALLQARIPDEFLEIIRNDDNQGA